MQQGQNTGRDFGRRLPVFSLALLTLLLISAIGAQAQTLHGRITDARTNEPLPSANIVIKGTYSGTISNADGEFELRSLRLPTVLVVRYIGYHSQEVEVASIPDGPFEIRMEPNIRELGEVMVTGKDPAIEIMREVIRRKQIWRATLESYSAQAYTRQNLESNNDIASISETLSNVYWHKEKGTREVITSKRQTANLGMDQNFASVGFMPNFYDDNLNIGGYDMVGPTHPNAFRFYNFELVGLRSLDNLTVFDIKVTSRRKLQPTFEGTLAVVDSAFALLEIDLRPNDALIFPPPIQKFDLWYAQQFSNFGGDYWLPVDVRIRGEIKFGIIGFQFPEIGIEQMSRLTDYVVNQPLPDTLYMGDRRGRLRVDSVKVKSDSLFLQSPLVVPFTAKEMTAYAEIDSSKTLDEAFRPTGFLAKLAYRGAEDKEGGVSISVNSGDSGGSTGQSRAGQSIGLKPSFVPDARFTRVDGLHLGVTASNPLLKYFRVSAGAGYSVSAERFDYRAGLRIKLPAMKRTVAHVDYATGTRTQYQSATTSPLFSSPNMLIGRPDYFDYYRVDGFKVDINHSMRFALGDISLIARSEKHGSLDKVTDYSLLDPQYVQRPNPHIEEGRLGSLAVKYVKGDDWIPFSIAGQNRLEVNVEVARPGLFGGDFAFARYEVAIDRRIPTFYKRRFLPNTLDLRLMAGTFSGNLPLQRFGIVDATPGHYAPYGALRTRAGHPYEGEQYAALHWEHNFRTIPFELLGLYWPARKGWGFLVYGSSGRTFVGEARLAQLRARADFDLAYLDGFHHEVGVSLNGIFGLGRINLTKRLDAPGLRLGYSVARYF